MRVLVQRVSHAQVQIGDRITGTIDQGLVLLAGIEPGDTQELVAKMARKIAHLRIFSNTDGKFSDSLVDLGGGALVVSQFTLFADARKGRRPNFSGAAQPEHAAPLVDAFATSLKDEGVSHVACGEFGASMRVSLCNEGPVTIWLDSREIFRQAH